MSATVIAGENIDKFRLITLKSALKLETKGMKHSRVNISKIVRGILAGAGIKGKSNKMELLVQFEDYISSNF